MLAVIQRVSAASVVVDDKIVGQINAGLCVLASVVTDDTPDDLAWMARKLAELRIFRNGEKHFDLDVKQIGGSMLLISNFTVAAEAAKGRRPSLSRAAAPEAARTMFQQFVDCARATGVPVETGIFAADMKVAIHNDGPATFLLNSKER